MCEAFFEKGDEVRMLPCLHQFHSTSCIEQRVCLQRRRPMLLRRPHGETRTFRSETHLIKRAICKTDALLKI